jgi:hypothetical protein
MSKPHPKPQTIHATLTPAEADSVARLSRDTGRSQRQIVRDALALLVGQQPTAVTAAQVIDGAMERIADRLQSALAAALAAQAEQQRRAWQADLQATATMLAKLIRPDANVVEEPRTNPNPIPPRSPFAHLDARKG